MVGIGIIFYLHGKRCFSPFPWEYRTEAKAMEMICKLQKENPDIHFCLVDLEGEIKK